MERALDILGALAFNNPRAGTGFSDLRDQTGLPKGTLHRLLKTLEAREFIERDRHSRRYFLGFQFLALGARAANRSNIREVARPSLERLAKITKDVVYLIVRTGWESLCLDVEEGSFPVRALTHAIGQRAPLGKGAGSAAILAALPDSEVADVLRINRNRLREHPKIDVPTVRLRIAATRQHGYSVIVGDGLKSMNSVGVAFFGPNRTPMGAMTVSALAERMSEERCKQVALWLKAECAAISDRLGFVPDAPHA